MVTKTTALDRKTNATIREWAKSQGINIGPRGAIPKNVRVKWDAALAQSPSLMEQPKVHKVTKKKIDEWLDNEPAWVAYGRTLARAKAVKKVVYLTTIAEHAIKGVA